VEGGESAGGVSGEVYGLGSTGRVYGSQRIRGRGEGERGGRRRMREQKTGVEGRIGAEGAGGMKVEWGGLG